MDGKGCVANPAQDVACGHAHSPFSRESTTWHRQTTQPKLSCAGGLGMKIGYYTPRVCEIHLLSHRKQRPPRMPFRSAANSLLDACSRRVLYCCVVLFDFRQCLIHRCRAIWNWQKPCCEQAMFTSKSRARYLKCRSTHQVSSRPRPFCLCAQWIIQRITQLSLGA